MHRLVLFSEEKKRLETSLKSKSVVLPLVSFLAPSVGHDHIKLFLSNSALSSKSRPKRVFLGGMRQSSGGRQSKAIVILDFARILYPDTVKMQMQKDN